MPQSQDPLRYQDLIEGILYPALAAPKGKRITFLTPGAAYSCKMRLHAAVKTLKRQSLEILDESHPRYGRSDFDLMVFQQDGCVLFVRNATAENIEDKLQAIMEDIL